MLLLGVLPEGLFFGVSELFFSFIFSPTFLRFSSKNDLANQVLNEKKKNLSNKKMHVVTVSKWLASQVKESVLLKNNPIFVIPNTLSLDEFKLLG